MKVFKWQSLNWLVLPEITHKNIIDVNQLFLEHLYSKVFGDTITMQMRKNQNAFTLCSHNYELHNSENLHMDSFNAKEWPESIFTALPLV